MPAPPWPRRLVFCLAVAAACFGPALEQAAAQSALSAAQLIDRYIAQDYPGVSAALGESLKSKATVAAMTKDLNRQLGQRPPMVAAAFALEVAAVAFDADQLGAQQLVDLGRRQLGRRGVTSRFELTWYLAATALLQGPPTLASLRVEMPGRSNDWPSGRITGPTGLPALLTQAVRRFPHRADLWFALGLAQEQLAHGVLSTRGFVMANPDRNPYQLMFMPGGAAVRYVGWDNDAQVLRLLDDAISTFFRATGSPDVAPLAWLHVGRLQSHVGRPAEASRAWKSVTFPIASDGAYLARLFRGRAHWLEQQVELARANVEQALAWRTGAQSALVSTAALQFLSGERDRAATLAERALSGQAVDHDPWQSYFRGEYEQWPVRIAQLRAELQ